MKYGFEIIVIVHGCEVFKQSVDGSTDRAYLEMAARQVRKQARREFGKKARIIENVWGY